MKALSVNNLKKTYSNGVIALKGISFDVEEGDFYGLLGPNGAGKSTTIGIISSLVNKDSGKVTISGKDLDKQKILIRAKVVKVSPMIMGKNWWHLQDGSGDAASKTHDLVVTTLAEAEKGAVVVIEGTVAADKDFGSGYRYDVIVEDAAIK